MKIDGPHFTPGKVRVGKKIFTGPVELEDENGQFSLLSNSKYSYYPFFNAYCLYLLKFLNLFSKKMFRLKYFVDNNLIYITLF